MNKFIPKIFFKIFEWLLILVILFIIMFNAQNYSPRLIVISIICTLIFILFLKIIVRFKPHFKDKEVMKHLILGSYIVILFLILFPIFYFADNNLKGGTDTVIFYSVICVLVFLVALNILIILKPNLKKNTRLMGIRFGVTFAILIPSVIILLSYVENNLQEGIMRLILSFSTLLLFFLGIILTFIYGVQKLKDNKLAKGIVLFFCLIGLPVTFFFSKNALLDIIYQEKFIQQGTYKLETHSTWIGYTK